MLSKPEIWNSWKHQSNVQKFNLSPPIPKIDSMTWKCTLSFYRTKKRSPSFVQDFKLFRKPTTPSTFRAIKESVQRHSGWWQTPLSSTNSGVQNSTCIRVFQLVMLLNAQHLYPAPSQWQHPLVNMYHVLPSQPTGCWGSKPTIFQFETRAYKSQLLSILHFQRPF